MLDEFSQHQEETMTFFPEYEEHDGLSLASLLASGQRPDQPG